MLVAGSKKGKKIRVKFVNWIEEEVKDFLEVWGLKYSKLRGVF